MSAIINGIVHQGSTVTLMARIRGADGELITQATISSIAYAVRDLTDGETDSTGTFTVSSVVFDSLQQDDPRWSRDSELRPGVDQSHGYNFLAELTAGVFDDHDIDTDDFEVTRHDFQVDVKFTATGGEVFVQSWRVQSIPVYV